MRGMLLVTIGAIVDLSKILHKYETGLLSGTSKLVDAALSCQDLHIQHPRQTLDTFTVFSFCIVMYML